MEITLKKSLCMVLLAGVVHGGMGMAMAQSDYPIAGMKPDERPADAPSITSVAKDAAWYQKALTGVEPPYPSSFRFLEDQGNWYTPFNSPGMTGPYDIRDWHDATQGPATTQ